MCGIAGIYHSGEISKADQEQVSTMLSLISHRGPDSSGIFTENSTLCFGSVRLAMTDSRNEINWLTNEDASVVLVFNGEIYNHRELREDLQKKGHTFKTQSDGEVILHLYEEREDNFLNELDGMFAFALWDSKKNLIFLARDPMGIKPLYYWIDKNKLFFASELKAFSPFHHLPIDPVSLSSYFHYRFVAPPKTIFQGISKLCPGTYLIFKNNTIDIKSYWKLDFNQKSTFSSFGTIWKEALETTSASDHQIGLFLSGGLDSGGILASLSTSKKKISTFTIGYENTPEQDEGDAALELSILLNSQHEYQQIKSEDILKYFSKAIWHLDEPLYSTVNLSTFCLSQMASKKVKGVLTGDGSDELLLGYSYLLKALEAFHKGENWKNIYLYQIGWMTENWASHLLEDEMRESKEDLLALFGGEDPIDNMRYFEIKYRLPEYHLTRVDRLSMAHGLEARLPLLRKKIVSHLLSYSSKELLVPGKQKDLLKTAFGSILPKSVIERKKQSFTSPFIHWLKGPLKEEVFDLILGTSTHERLGLKQKGLKAMLQNCYHGDGSAFAVLWGIFTLYKWDETFQKR